MTKLGGGTSVCHQNTCSLIPVSAHSANNKIRSTIAKLEATPEGGQFVGILQPIWEKALESIMRLEWLRKMLRKGLVVREIQSFGFGVNEKLRTESARGEELGRETKWT